MQVALLETCEYLVAGSTIQAMVSALKMSKKGRTILVTQDTCLYAEMTHTGDFRMPRGIGVQWRDLLFPKEVFSGEQLHPDKLKKCGEDVLRQHGVVMLYACQALGMRDGYVLAAHKSGLYVIECQKAYDARRMPVPHEPCYCLNAMKDGVLKTLIIRTAYVGDEPRAQYQRYQEALEHLAAGSTLARGGYAASDAQGWVLSDAEREPPLLAPFLSGHHTPRMDNPLNAKRIMAQCPPLGAKEDTCEVLVVGGGTAGALAAITAGRAGKKTVVLEMNHCLGGTATAGGVSTYWFGLRSGATKMLDEAVQDAYERLKMPRQRCLWSEDDVFAPDLKSQVLLQCCLGAEVEIHFGAVVFGVSREAQKVTGIYYAQGGKVYCLHAAQVIDCTGDGDVCMFSGAGHTYGSERDGMTYWASLAQYITPDKYKNNFSTMVHVGDPLDYTRFIIAGRRRGGDTYDHGQYVAVRESRHIQGLKTVTLEDIVAMRPVQDPLYVCFSNYDPKGRLTANMVYFGLLPPNQRICVPRGAVIPVDRQKNAFDNLLVGGKAISCTHDAFPGIRMQPDLQRQGLALAVLACCAIDQKTTAAQVTGFREKIICAGGDLDYPILDEDENLQCVINHLNGSEAWEWLDESPQACHTGVAPIIRIMTAEGDTVLPLLQQAYDHTEEGSKKVTLARLLLWHGDERGAEIIMHQAEALLDAQPGLPIRKASVNYGQMLPDHGLMPELVYLLNTLGNTRKTVVQPLFEHVLIKLENTSRDWRDLQAGIFCYCECFGYVALKRRDQGMVPFIRRVLALPEMQKEAEDELLEERLQMLRLILLGACAALGGERERLELKRYTNDPRRVIAEAAEAFLTNG